MRGRIATVVAFLVVGALALPAMASASSISKSGGTLTLTDPLGQDNDLTLNASSGDLVFVESQAGQTIETSEPSCTGGGTDTVTCSSSGVTQISIDAEDGADSVTLGDSL